MSKLAYGPKPDTSLLDIYLPALLSARKSVVQRILRFVFMSDSFAVSSPWLASHSLGDGRSLIVGLLLPTLLSSVQSVVKTASCSLPSLTLIWRG